MCLSMLCVCHCISSVVLEKDWDRPQYIWTQLPQEKGLPRASSMVKAERSKQKGRIITKSLSDNGVTTCRRRWNCFWGNICTCCTQTGKPHGWKQRPICCEQGGLPWSQETQRHPDNPKSANRHEQQQGMTDLKKCVEKAMKGAEVRADLTQPPGCTRELAKWPQ